MSYLREKFREVFMDDMNRYENSDGGTSYEVAVSSSMKEVESHG